MHEKEEKKKLNFVFPGSGTVESVTTRNVSGSVHDYGWDGWLGPVCVQLLPSIFLSDERGERQHTVICCAATADNSKSPPQSHLPSSEMAWGGSCRDKKGKNVVNLLGNAPADNHMPHAAVESTARGGVHISLLHILLSE